MQPKLKPQDFQEELCLWMSRLNAVDSGLTAAEAGRRLKPNGYNESVVRSKWNTVTMLTGIVNPLNLILLLAGFASMVLGEILNATIYFFSHCDRNLFVGS